MDTETNNPVALLGCAISLEFLVPLEKVPAVLPALRHARYQVDQTTFVPNGVYRQALHEVGPNTTEVRPDVRTGPGFQILVSWHGSLASDLQNAIGRIKELQEATFFE